MESALTISAFISLASATAKSLFPVAVAPQITIKLIEILRKQALEYQARSSYHLVHLPKRYVHPRL